MPFSYTRLTSAKSLNCPPAHGSMHTMSCGFTGSSIGGQLLNMRFRSHCRNAWSTDENATPLISELMRSGRSLMIVFRRSCFSSVCHAGIKCMLCVHSCPRSASMHFWHASCICTLLNSGWLVTGSTLLISLV
jgi:hypothetical protein